ncbi:MAG: hypothetical protein PWQ75_797 [Methanolobus sp.]|jgi:hypothetical protein|uniref:rolling circle replication-associated protein n=1 Tax=Methanolobus sp. TaxID=1874737 RepID=UPI0024AC3AFD|nr:hypothetical protein [Methanolobus sp.]MDI3485604.1 hypothetical protein [Methanolobus sp.]MDK2831045.1 hypothetical protein [Methanolobus sp.]
MSEIRINITPPEDRFLYIHHLAEQQVIPQHEIYETVYDMRLTPQLAWQRIERLQMKKPFAKAYNKINKNKIKHLVKNIGNALFKSKFYCEGEWYKEIMDIPYNDKVKAYHKKIKNMKFSDDTYVNVDKSIFYAKLCYAFECGLDNINHAKLKLSYMDEDTYQIKEFVKSLEYRNSESYKKGVIKKMYKLMEGIKELPPEEQGVTMVTLTTYQRVDGHGVDYIQQYQTLQMYKNRLHDTIRKDHKGIQYTFVTEAHKTGYLHFHIVYNCIFTAEEMERYKLLWSQKYGVGSYEHGIDFQYNDNTLSEQTIEARMNGYDNVTSSISYLIKYTHKSISPESQNAPFYQFLSDAIIWYVSRNHNGFKGMRTNTISQGWLDDIVIPKLVDEAIETEKVHYKLMRYKKGAELILDAVANERLDAKVIYGYGIEYIRAVLEYCGKEIVMKNVDIFNNINEQLITPTIPSPPYPIKKVMEWFERYGRWFERNIKIPVDNQIPLDNPRLNVCLDGNVTKEKPNVNWEQVDILLKGYFKNNCNN